MEVGKLPHLKIITLLLSIFFISSANADDFFNNYSSAKFEAAYDSFEQSVQTAAPGANYESYLNALLNIYPQVEGKPIKSLKSKVESLTKVKIPFFLRKRIKSDLGQLESYEKLKYANEGTLENAILEAAAIKDKGLTYNHARMSRLRIVQMVITNRSYSRRNTKSDLYLSALIDYHMSKGGRDLVEKYLESASVKEPFYSKAVELKAKFE
jgi:hypothetical protein